MPPDRGHDTGAGGPLDAPPLPLWPPLLIGAALRLVQIQAPVLGIHSWRQADTAAMARNFAEQGMRFWLPQIDWGGTGSGVVEAEFPLYPYGVALLYRLFGVHEWLARGLSLACSLLTILLLIRIGRRLVGERAGWWGGLFYAVLPIPVFYGRTVQPEALLMLLAALALERFLVWLQGNRRRDLLVSWLAFSGACLVKVLPFLWLGAPLLWLLVEQRWQGRWALALRRPGPWLYALGAVGLTSLWYWHARQLGESSGLSFGFWGGEANRYSWADLLGFAYWGELGLRVAVRNLAVLGVPLLILGLLPPRPGGPAPPQPLGRVLPLGLGGVILAGALAPETTAVHEYYQLPLMLFACPLMGQGWLRLRQGPGGWRRRAWALLVVMVLVSLSILGIDYWSKERTAGSAAWELARRIQAETPAQARVVVASGSDPTVLYLADRKGWLVSPDGLSKHGVDHWRRRGADAVAGSYAVIESFQPFPDGPRKDRLRRWVCAQAPGCQEGPSFVVPLGAAATPSEAPRTD
ncbi:glycosyltransferase family 39 protein [Synechococcus sp. CCY 9618]|uniref:ArnT family glycosyltransferase n=1 Tax=Synechococcus sp. CCY 9618 TaxID=2815602 RepID=UPI001C215A8D|nr:glycosyltransferase family 39 protein [Synechococcus sp. CCY 9618]